MRSDRLDSAPSGLGCCIGLYPMCINIILSGLVPSPKRTKYGKDGSIPSDIHERIKSPEGSIQ